MVRERIVKIRLTDEEFGQIAAGASGRVTVARFIREAALRAALRAARRGGAPVPKLAQVLMVKIGLREPDGGRHG